MNPDHPEIQVLAPEAVDCPEAEDLQPETPGKNLSGPGLCLLVSALIHGLVLFLLLYSGAAIFGGPAAISGENVVTVSLVESPGDGLPPGAAEEPGGEPAVTEEQMSAEDKSESPEERDEDRPAPATEADAPPPDDSIPEPQPPVEELETEPEALAVKPTQPKAEPRPPRTSKPAAKPAKRTEAVSSSPKSGPPGADKAAGRSTTGDRSRTGSGDKAGQGKGAAQGGGGQGDYRKANYNYIQKSIQRNMSYPPQARRMGITGRVTVVFTVSRSGQAANIRVSRSSGNDSLDAAAIAAVKKASPFPPPPAPATISIPLVFGLK